MPSTQEFRRRIKSVNNTKQITKAMEMIASIKMQKATRTIQEARTYIQNAWNILHLLSTKVLAEDHPLIKEKEAKREAVVLITSDRGLCGSYNSEVIKKLSAFRLQTTAEVRSPKSEVRELDIIAIGKVGAAFVNRYKVGNLVAEFKGFENNISSEDVMPIAKMTIEEFLAGKYDRIAIIYSHFVSSLKQVPVIQQILPITKEHIDRPELWENSNRTSDYRLQSESDSRSPKSESSDYKFEPSPEAVFDSVLRQILRTQIFGAVLEANASEHSARMVAMKNATDNAKNLIGELTLAYNSVRQDNITREIAEISGAAKSMR